MIDLNEIQSLRQAEVEITHPISGKPLGAFVTLASPDHPARRNAIAAASRRLREAGDDGAELLDELTEETVTGSILGWRGILLDGVELVFSCEAARDLLKRPQFYWLLRQLVIKLGEQENFIKTSAPG